MNSISGVRPLGYELSLGSDTIVGALVRGWPSARSLTTIVGGVVGVAVGDSRTSIEGSTSTGPSLWSIGVDGNWVAHRGRADDKLTQIDAVRVEMADADTGVMFRVGQWQQHRAPLFGIVDRPDQDPGRADGDL